MHCTKFPPRCAILVGSIRADPSFESRPFNKQWLISKYDWGAQRSEYEDYDWYTHKDEMFKLNNHRQIHSRYPHGPLRSHVHLQKPVLIWIPVKKTLTKIGHGHFWWHQCLRRPSAADPCFVEPDTRKNLEINERAAQLNKTYSQNARSGYSINFVSCIWIGGLKSRYCSASWVLTSKRTL